MPPSIYSSRERGSDTKGKKGKNEGVGCCPTPFLRPPNPASCVGPADGDGGVFVPHSRPYADCGEWVWRWSTADGAPLVASLFVGDGRPIASSVQTVRTSPVLTFGGVVERRLIPGHTCHVVAHPDPYRGMGHTGSLLDWCDRTRGPSLSTGNTTPVPRSWWAIMWRRESSPARVERGRALP